MRFAGTFLTTLLFCAVVHAQDAASAAAIATDSPAADKPYATIVERNIFGLVPIPPPDPDADKPPAEPPPKITPTGIMTIFGKLQALFKVANKPKPNQPAKEDSHVLAEGEREDDIEVVKIDQPNRTITFNNHGTVQELPLVAAKDTGTAPASGSGGARPTGNSGFGIPRPGAMSAADRAAMLRERAAERMNQLNPAANPNAANSGGFANPASSQLGAEVNERGIYQPSADTSGMTPEQTALLIEAQRKVYEQQGSPVAPLMPPTRKDIRDLVNQIDQNGQ